MSCPRRRLSASMKPPYCARLLGVGHPAAPQQLTERLDRCQRRAQLVRHVGDEVALELGQPQLARSGADGVHGPADQHDAEHRRESDVDQEVLPGHLLGAGTAALHHHAPVAEDEVERLGRDLRLLAEAPQLVDGDARTGGPVLDVAAAVGHVSDEVRERRALEEVRHRLLDGVGKHLLAEVIGVDDDPGDSGHAPAVVENRVEDHARARVALVDMEPRALEQSALLRQHHPGRRRHVHGFHLVGGRLAPAPARRVVEDDAGFAVLLAAHQEHPLDALQLALIEVAEGCRRRRARDRRRARAAG